jgi:hypothetical protein
MRPPFEHVLIDVIKASERSTDVIDEHAQGEKVELELDAFITKRDAQRRRAEGERPAQEIWMESERRYNARRKAENDAAWLAFHEGHADRLRRNLGALVAQHEAAASKYRTYTQEGDAA